MSSRGHWAVKSGRNAGDLHAGWSIRATLGVLLLLSAAAPAAAQLFDEPLSGVQQPVAGARLEIAPSGVLSPEQARVGREQRHERLRERYEAWRGAPAERPRDYAVPELPRDADVPPPPDAPDGEITRAQAEPD